MNKEEFLQQFWKNLIHVSDAERGRGKVLHGIF